MNENKDFKKLIFGNDASKKINQFNDGLKKIENSYFEYFEERKLKNNLDKHDCLSNHYMTTSNIGGFIFKFNEESDLKEEIKVKCQVLFNSIFNQPN